MTAGTNKKHEIFTNINSSDQTDFAYRSTTNYLRQVTNQQNPFSSTEMNTGRSLVRTRSATDLTPRTNRPSSSGNPKYKAQEDYYDEIQTMKKDMKNVKEENSNLRSKIRRLEEDNARKRKEIDALYDPSKDGDLRRTISGSNTDRNNNNNNSNAANVVMSLKQRLFKLELQLKQKEIEIDELKSDPRRTKSTELEIQNRALLGELERQKVERLNYIQQNDYMATVDEEKKNAVRKLNQEKDALKKENESLKKKIQDFQKLDRGEQLSARPIDSNIEKESKHKANDFNRAEQELEQMQKDFDKVRRERDRLRNDLDHTKEELEEIRNDQDQSKRKGNHQFDKVQYELEQATNELRKLKREREHNERKIEGIDEKLRDTENERDRLKKELERTKDELELERKKQSRISSSPPLKRPESPITRTSLTKSFVRPESPPTRVSPTKPFGRSQSPPSDDEVSSKADIKPKIPTPSNSKLDVRPGSATSVANETALKTVQAALRGYLHRSEINKASQDRIQHRSKSPDIKSRTNSFNTSRTSIRDSTAHVRRDPSPPSDDKRSPSPPARNWHGSKSSLLNDQKRPTTRSSTPPLSFDDNRPASPAMKNLRSSKSSLLNEQNKLGPEKRSTTSIRDSLSGVRRTPQLDEERPSSPFTRNNRNSKPNVLDNQIKSNPRASPPNLRRTPSPPPVAERSLSSRFPNARNSKTNSFDDEDKFTKRPSSGSRHPSSPKIPSSLSKIVDDDDDIVMDGS